MRPSSTAATASARDIHDGSSCSSGSAMPRRVGQVGREEEVHELGAEARGGEELRAGLPRGRRQTAFLGELAARGLVRRLARLERPGRDLEQRLAGRVPPLADHGEPLAVPGEDRGRPGMLDDLARRSMAVRTLDLVDTDRDPLAGPRPRAADRSLLHAGEPTPRRSGHGPRAVNPARMRATCSSPPEHPAR